MDASDVSWPTGGFSVAMQNPQGIGVVNVWEMSLTGSGLALNAAANASSQHSFSYVAAFAVDSNPLTRWLSRSPSGNRSEYLEVDLLGAHTVSWFRIEWAP